jgi:hypothetical protein
MVNTPLIWRNNQESIPLQFFRYARITKLWQFFRYKISQDFSGDDAVIDLCGHFD